MTEYFNVFSRVLRKRPFTLLSVFVGLLLSMNMVGANPLSPEQLYQQSCLVCHGDDGSGNMPGVPDLADSKTLSENDDAFLLGRIKAGIQTPGNIVMPPKGGNPALTDEQLLSVLRYVRQLLNEP